MKNTVLVLRRRYGGGHAFSSLKNVLMNTRLARAASYKFARIVNDVDDTKPAQNTHEGAGMVVAVTGSRWFNDCLYHQSTKPQLRVLPINGVEQFCVA